MKIKIVFASFIVLIGLSTFLVSCKKDEDTKLPTCRCTIEYIHSDEETGTIDLSDEDDVEDLLDLEVGDIKTCKQLADYIEDEGPYYSEVRSASCKER